MISCDFSMDARNELKFHDFVSINICHLPLKPFFKKNFEILKKGKKNFDCSNIKIFFFKLKISTSLVLRRPSAGRDLRLRLQPECIVASDFDGVAIKLVRNKMMQYKGLSCLKNCQTCNQFCTKQDMYR